MGCSRKITTTYRMHFLARILVLCGLVTSLSWAFAGCSGDSGSADVWANSAAVGFTVVPDNTVILESNEVGRFTVKLDREPANGDVILNITNGNPDQATLNHANLVFSDHLGDSPWFVAQSVLVTPIDDTIKELDQTVVVTVSVAPNGSSDEYDNLEPQSVTLTIKDDDTATFADAGITIISGVSTFSENGGTGSFKVQLDSPPKTGNVVITALLSDDTEGTLSNSTLTFTPATGNFPWYSPQTITIKGLDDDFADGDQSIFVTIGVDTAQSSDEYDALPTKSVSMTVQDDDTANVIQTAGTMTFSENGGTGNFTVALSTEPVAGDVVINLASGDASEALVSPATLTFTNSAGVAPWNIPQTVTVTGVDDSVTDGDETVSINLTIDAANSTAEYGGITLASASVTVTDNDVLSALTLSGIVSTFAGDGTAATLNGTGTAAQFNGPTGLASDGTRLFVAEQAGHVIRQIDIATGVVSTFAGDGTSGNLDGTGTAAKFSAPFGLATDGVNVYVADRGNNAIRQIVIATGVVTTLSTSFIGPTGLAVDGNYLYIAEADGNAIWSHSLRNGTETRLAGWGVAGTSDGNGANVSYNSSTSAHFDSPMSLSWYNNALYIVELNNRKIRKINLSTYAVTSISGSGSTGSANGAAGSASYNAMHGVTTDGTNLYISGYANHIIRNVAISTGTAGTLAGAALTSGTADGTGGAARFNGPSGIANDGTSLFVSDFNNNIIRKID